MGGFIGLQLEKFETRGNEDLRTCVQLLEDVYRRSRSWPAAPLGPIYRGIDPLRMVIWEKPGKILISASRIEGETGHDP